jgi:hypothetical protein
MHLCWYRLLQVVGTCCYRLLVHVVWCRLLVLVDNERLIVVMFDSVIGCLHLVFIF